MKGSSIFLMVVLLAVIAGLAYYNFEQKKTIELLNQEILEQARLRHNLILEKHILLEKMEKLKADSLSGTRHLPEQTQ